MVQYKMPFLYRLCVCVWQSLLDDSIQAKTQTELDLRLQSEAPAHLRVVHWDAFPSCK